MREIPKEQVKQKIKFLNPHWERGQVAPDIEAKTPRKYFDFFFPLVHESTVHRAVVLLGPRRVGKTVLLWHTVRELIKKQIDPKNILYLPLDDPIFYAYSLENLLDLYREIFSFSELTGQVVLFDEIQYLKDWDIQLKILVDQFKSARFIVSGSAAGALKRKSQESGAGRFTDFLLPPLTFYEFLDLQNLTEELFTIDHQTLPDSKNIEELNHHFIKYINYGGFPEAIFNEDIRRDPQRFIRGDIIEKVLLRDLPSLYGIRDTQELSRFFSALAYQTGCEVSYEGLSQYSGVAKNTLKKYIEYLEAAFLIQKVKRVDETGKRFRRENFFKVYLTNPSTYSALFGPVSENDSNTLGNLVETAIFSQWMHVPRLSDKIFYARWKGGKGEVDMVSVSEKLNIDWCLEVKWSDRNLPTSREVANLVEFCKQNHLKTAWMTTKSKTFSIPAKEDVNLKFLTSSWTCFVIGYQITRERFLQPGPPWSL